MKRANWRVSLGVILVLSSILLYILHFLIFRDPHHIFVYFLGDVAFVPIEVLLVTLIIHQLLQVRERNALLKKLNMVVGAFFSEVGSRLLQLFSEFDPNADRLKQDLIVRSEWTNREFGRLGQRLTNYRYSVEVGGQDLDELKGFLTGERDFLLRLLENPNLLEHESFTDLLWAVFHLAEELAHRKDVTKLPASDYRHLAGDMERVYSRLVSQWVAYMDHLRTDYPYLFSLAMRTNPFDPSAMAEVVE